jgi:hypothetical protein
MDGADESSNVFASDVHWRDMDKRRFFVFGGAAFLGVRALAYPAVRPRPRRVDRARACASLTSAATQTLVKTRMQVSNERVSTWTVLRSTYREGGMRSLYRGACGPPVLRPPDR